MVAVHDGLLGGMLKRNCNFYIFLVCWGCYQFESVDVCSNCPSNPSSNTTFR